LSPAFASTWAWCAGPAASVTKSVTAVVTLSLAHQGRLALDDPLAGQLAPELLHRWRALDALPRTTPRQLLAHTSGLPNLGHTGFIGAFAFHASEYDAVLAGTHNASQVDRWPLVAALCRELREAA
jgi:CubicO group peptidase (beta-lactamase class C family)